MNHTPGFTPGPWQPTNSMYGIGNLQVWGVEDRQGNAVANCGVDGYANAALIAAAPAMYEALEIVYGNTTTDVDGLDHAELMALVRELSMVAQAALAAARGNTGGDK